MKVVVIFGSNSGDRQTIIEKAIAILSANAGSVAIASSFYETAPWGFESDEMFMNKTAVFDTLLTPEKFLDECLKTEQFLGRTRTAGIRYSSRTIDIDLLFYDKSIVNTPTLTIPHPRMCERNFVLTPLNEIIPDFTHPVCNRTISELLSVCPDRLPVRKIQQNRL